MGAVLGSGNQLGCNAGTVSICPSVAVRGAEGVLVSSPCRFMAQCHCTQHSFPAFTRDLFSHVTFGTQIWNFGIKWASADDASLQDSDFHKGQHLVELKCCSEVPSIGAPCPAVPTAAGTYGAEPELLQPPLPLHPALQNGLCPKFLRCTRIYVGLLKASSKGQGKQKGRSDSNYLMH